MTVETKEKRETHTPGPWYCTFPDETSSGGVYGGEKCVCDIIPKELQVAWDCEEVSTARANARLIAAAPETLKALKDLVKEFDAYESAMCQRFSAGHEDYGRQRELARLAIAKAEGGGV